MGCLTLKKRLVLLDQQASVNLAIVVMGHGVARDNCPPDSLGSHSCSLIIDNEDFGIAVRQYMGQCIRGGLGTVGDKRVNQV